MQPFMHLECGDVGAGHIKTAYYRILSFAHLDCSYTMMSFSGKGNDSYLGLEHQNKLHLYSLSARGKHNLLLHCLQAE
jgi:hypothetical protein